LQEDSDGDGFGDVCDSENSFALIDTVLNKMVVFDLAGNPLYEKDFNDTGICFFVSPSTRGWLVKGCPLSGWDADNWIIWDLRPDLSVANTIMNLGPGPFYTGITSGNFIVGDVFTGIINLHNPGGTIIGSTNVWQEENGWPYDYNLLGEIAGLANGGFVVPPEGGYYGLYTPYLYFYDNDLHLIKKVDISNEKLHLFNLNGLSDGGFVATCADSGYTDRVQYLCFFNSEGKLTEKIDISGDLPEPHDYNYMNVFVAGLRNGEVMVSKYGYDKVWFYHSQLEALNVSAYGIAGIGSIAGNVLQVPESLSCAITINPATAEVVSGKRLDFTAAVTGECAEPHYEWSVESAIGSTCDKSGTYTAGFNFDIASPKTDIVRVVDTGNGGISTAATVSVLSPCAAEQIYGTNATELTVLRQFRDEILNKTPAGRQLTRLYYAWSPAIVEAMSEDEAFKQEIKKVIDSLLPVIEAMVK